MRKRKKENYKMEKVKKKVKIRRNIVTLCLEWIVLHGLRLGFDEKINKSMTWSS